MKTAHDVVGSLLGAAEHRAKRLDEAPTGVEPGYDPISGLAFSPNGTVRHRSGGSSASSPIGFIAQYELDSDQTRSAGNTDRVDFNVMVFDPGHYVTTGAGWYFTPPVDGLYRFWVSTLLIPDAGFSVGEKVYFKLWPDSTGTGVMTVAYLEIGVNEAARDQIQLQGSVTRGCYTTDHIGFKFSNGASFSMEQLGNNSEPYATTITIERLSTGFTAFDGGGGGFTPVDQGGGHLSSAATIANGATSQINFNTVDTDPFSQFAGAVFTSAAAMDIQVDANCAFTGSITPSGAFPGVSAGVYKNGALIAGCGSFDMSAGSYPSGFSFSGSSFGTPITVAIGDTIEIRLHNFSGVTLTYDTGGGTSWEITQVG